jgi:hypothetical protein
MKESIRIIPAVAVTSRQTNLACQIEFAYRDPRIARRVVQDLTQRFGGEVLDPASLNTNPVGPNPKVLAFIGLVGGLTLGGLLALFRRSPKTA